MNQLLFALIFFLPAGFANTTPVLVKRLPFLKNWNTPIDLGLKINNHRILGDNKTWRGVIFGGLVGGLVGWVLYKYISHSGIQEVSHFWVGAFLGYGALFGDAVESFVKRQLKIKSGESWFPFDQIDFVLGAFLFSIPFVRLALLDYVLVIVVYLLLHVVVSYLGYKLKFKDKPI